MLRVGRNGLVWVAQDDSFLHPTTNGTKIPLTAYGTDKDKALANLEKLFMYNDIRVADRRLR